MKINVPVRSGESYGANKDNNMEWISGIPNIWRDAGYVRIRYGGKTIEGWVLKPAYSTDYQGIMGVDEWDSSIEFWENQVVAWKPKENK